jgi:NADH-quinone oxidoreductase subunit K
MFATQFVVSVLLFSLGVIGILLKRNSILIILMCIELMLLGVNINFILLSLYLDDVTGQI